MEGLIASWATACVCCALTASRVDLSTLLAVSIEPAPWRGAPVQHCVPARGSEAMVVAFFRKPLPHQDPQVRGHHVLRRALRLCSLVVHGARGGSGRYCVNPMVGLMSIQRMGQLLEEGAQHVLVVVGLPKRLWHQQVAADHAPWMGESQAGKKQRHASSHMPLVVPLNDSTTRLLLVTGLLPPLSQVMHLAFVMLVGASSSAHAWTERER